MHLLFWINEFQALNLHDKTDEKFSILLLGERSLFMLTNFILFFAITVLTLSQFSL